MNNLSIFNNAELGDVRVLNIDNEPYFVGKDICTMFGDKTTIVVLVGLMLKIKEQLRF